jgi:hypothetical protein
MSGMDTHEVVAQVFRLKAEGSDASYPTSGMLTYACSLKAFGLQPIHPSYHMRT